MAWLTPLTVRGDRVTLEPLSLEHADELGAAVRDGELWQLWYTDVPAPQNMTAEIQRRLDLQAAGEMLPFAAIDNSTARAVGMTTLLNPDAQNKRVEIGATWYRNSVQRTAFNTECKLLLLSHVFGQLDCVAVEFRTHFFNRQSRRGIERLGAKLDGILRNHRRQVDGTLRDTCVYSILVSEWPTVRSHLEWQLHRPRPDKTIHS